MSKTIENLKSGNYKIVDKQGVSVTQHFIKCLEKELAEKEFSENDILMKEILHLNQAITHYKLQLNMNIGKDVIPVPMYIADLQSQIVDLKDKLANSEKQVEQLKHLDELNKTFFDLFRNAFKEPDKVDDAFNTLKTMLEKQEQDKILFAIEQLEKAEGKIQHNIVFADCTDYLNVIEEISNHIEELKKGE